MKRLVVGITAHVDSGKTTLSEALLYRTGEIRKLGRVDHQTAFLDTHPMERDRGITIFAHQACIACENAEYTLLDTPGHVDFSAETERTMQVLDYAILVISGTDGVQSHTETLWKLLERYQVPVFLFVNKMDLAGADKAAVLEQLQTAGIATTPVAWSETAFFCTDSTTEAQLQALSCYENGEIYLQSLSSMLPPIVLQPQPKQEILDMTAAPGGKTTQMAAMTQNQANIMACELHAIRAEKLKYNVEKQGAKRVTVSITDARRLSPYFSFDRILLDAPCSGSGTLSLHTGAGLQNFSPALVQKTVKAQRALLKKAVSLLKKNQEMVYSTCSILPEENEEQVAAILKTGQVELLPIAFPGMETLPLLPSRFAETLCVCPDAQYEGFFVAKLRKKANG